MNERQMDVIMGIVQENLEDYMSTDLTEEICGGIREGISDNMELIDQLGWEDRWMLEMIHKHAEQNVLAGKNKAKRGTKMEDGCLVPADKFIRILLEVKGE